MKYLLFVDTEQLANDGTQAPAAAPRATLREPIRRGMHRCLNG